jgi:hypothetical protein
MAGMPINQPDRDVDTRLHGLSDDEVMRGAPQARTWTTKSRWKRQGGPGQRSKSAA